MVNSVIRVSYEQHIQMSSHWRETTPTVACTVRWRWSLLFWRSLINSDRGRNYVELSVPHLPSLHRSRGFTEIEIEGIIGGPRVLYFEFSLSAVPLDAKLRARFANEDKSPRRRAVASERAYLGQSCISKRGARVSQYSRNAKRRFPPCEIVSTCERRDPRSLDFLQLFPW